MVLRSKNIPDQILPNVLDMIGQTPMIRLDKIAKSEGLECDLRKYSSICAHTNMYACTVCSVSIRVHSVTLYVYYVVIMEFSSKHLSLEVSNVVQRIIICLCYVLMGSDL